MIVFIEILLYLIVPNCFATRQYPLPIDKPFRIKIIISGYFTYIKLKLTNKKTTFL